MTKYYRVLLFVILVLFLVTRLYKVGQLPGSVYWDEASIGYNAYSVLETGRDEWGEFMPLHFRAFGEFKLPVYAYSVIPFISVFGLNEVSVRLPSVFFAFGTIILVYLLAIKLTNKRYVGLLSAFFLVVSPWYFLFSRTGYEAVAGLFFFMFGLLLYFHSLNKPQYLVLTALSWIAAFYSYNAYRIIVPISLVIFGTHFIHTYKNKLNKVKVEIVVSLVLIVLSVFPLIKLFGADHGASRFGSIGLEGSYLGMVKQFVTNYISHFNPNFLFIKGDANPRSHVPGLGQLYLFDLILLVSGLILVIKKKSFKYYSIPFLILIGIIPASITREAPHALRSMSVVPFISILAALGVMYFINKYVKYKSLIIVATVVVYLAGFVFYFNGFINNYWNSNSEYWQSAYKDVFNNYKHKDYDNIYVSDKYAQPYIFSLFYQGIDPVVFRNGVSHNAVDNWGFSTVDNYGIYNFSDINQISGKSLLFVTDKDSDFIQNDLIKVSEVLFEDGSLAFTVYETKED